MRNDIFLTAAALSLLFASVAGSREYLYTPAPADPSAAPAADGVLVREVTVRKGDTLYQLSRQFSGRGSYYPQILLFNELKNPNLIYPGNVLRIPVGHRGVTAETSSARHAAEPPASRHPVAAPAKQQPGTSPVSRKKAAERTPTASPAQPPTPTATERSRYAGIEAALRAGDCRAALPLLDSFIADYPDSPLTPEAALNRAECYLKISSP